LTLRPNKTLNSIVRTKHFQSLISLVFNSYFEADKTVRNDQFWTGAYELSDAITIHCPVGDLMPNFKHWKNITIENKEQSSAGGEFCYTIGIISGTKTLRKEPCSSKQNFICEVRV
jgi:hypothetical protein